MVHPSELIIGEAYFLIVFYDSAMRIPRIETYLYDKTIINYELGETEYWFRTPGQQLALDSSGEDSEYYVVDEKGLFMIYNLKSMIKYLEKRL